VTVATDLGVPRSTARGWLGAASTVVVCLDVADLTEPELRQEVLQLRRRVQKLTTPWCAKTRPSADPGRLVLSTPSEEAFCRGNPAQSDGAQDATTSYLLNRGCPSGQAATMDPLPAPLDFLLLLFSGWVNRQQQAAIDYLLEENRVLRAVTGSRRLGLTTSDAVWL